VGVVWTKLLLLQPSLETISVMQLASYQGAGVENSNLKTARAVMHSLLIP
jgi:hypothetical protein